MFSFYLLLLVITSNLVLSRPPAGSYHPIVKHGVFPDNIIKSEASHGRRSDNDRRQTPSAATCNSGKQIRIQAPKTNIFEGLTDDEAAAATAFLHTEKRLNLTAAASATR